MVRRIYDYYLREGLKMNAISRRLDAEGVRPRHAERWSTSTTAVILRNEAYIGKAAYLKTTSTGRRARRNRTGRRQAGAVRRLVGRTTRPREEWIELTVPAILDETTFARAQQRRADNRRFSPRKTAVSTLLQGLCVCAECGYTIGRNSAKISAQALSLVERQRIVRLLIREVRIGKESVTICHSIPVDSIPPAGAVLDGGAPCSGTSAQGALLIPRCRNYLLLGIPVSHGGEVVRESLDN